MITNAQIILCSFMTTLSSESCNHFDHYKPHTTTSMIKSDSLEFYENFWEYLIKEDCDSNSMVE
jgi:hypothetical protein